MGVTMDAAPTTGNLLIACLCTNFNPGTVTPPAGWTEIASYTSGPYTYLYRRVVQGGDSATVTYSFTTARRASIVVREYAGADTAAPIDVSASNGGSGTSLSAGTTGTIDTGNIYSEAWFGFASTSEWTSGIGFTDGYTLSHEVIEPGAAPAIRIAANTGVTPGITTTTTVSTTSAGGNAWGCIFVIAHGPLAAGTASMTDRTATTASLSATDAPGGAAPNTYQWHRSTSSGFTPGGGNAVSAATSLTLTDTGLTEGVTYYYVIVYTDSEASTAASNEVSVTPSGSPLVVITDDYGATSGTIAVMAPGSVSFHATASLLGSGTWLNCKIEWDFGDSGSTGNQIRGFGAGHLYNAEPGENTDYTVTCTITNVAGLSAASTRTVQLQPNTRRIVYVDPDTGSASPSDPTDSGDPYDTIANCVANETQTDLEIRCTAGKTHVWGATPGGGTGDNVHVRSTVSGSAFSVTTGVVAIMSGGVRMGLRDILCITSGYGSHVRFLDQRNGSGGGRRCYLYNCHSTDPDVSLLVTGPSTGTVSVNTSTAHNISNDAWVSGDMITLIGHTSDYSGSERPIRGSGNHVTLRDCLSQYRASNGKTSCSRTGGQFFWADQCDFEFLYTAGSTSGTPLQIGHTSGGGGATAQYSVVERCRTYVAAGVTGSVEGITIGADSQSVVDVVVRNCVIDGRRASIGSLSESYPVQRVWFLHNTINVNNTLHLYLNNYYDDITIKNCLGIGYTSGQETVIVSSSTRTPLLTNNVMPVADGNQDVRVDGGSTRLTWAQFNVLGIGTGNASKNITLGSSYRPADVEDVDLLKTSLSEMTAVAEDYHGTARSGGTWVAGAVGAVSSNPPVYAIQAGGLFFFIQTS